MQKKTSEFKDYSQCVQENSSLSWLLSKYENASERYMEAEDFIIQIAEMKWYQRAFCVPKILKFLDSRKKYNGIVNN